MGMTIEKNNIETNRPGIWIDEVPIPPPLLHAIALGSQAASVLPHGMIELISIEDSHVYSVLQEAVVHPCG